MNKKKSSNQHIQVFVRCRPLLKSELAAPIPVEVHPEVNKILVREGGSDKCLVKTFSFDKVFGPESSQADIYAAVVAPVVPEVIHGFNCTIFAYGQTGTGKTFTIEGGKSSNLNRAAEDPLSGIIPRAMRHLFKELSDQKTEFDICVSFLELYNEEIFDLLSKPDDYVKLKMFDSSSQKGGVLVQGLKVLPVTSMEEVYAILDIGCKKRRKATTLLNETSSRSHTIFTVMIKVKESSSTMEKTRIGKLNLVDLAGSENIGRSGAIDKRAREAGNINQSLLALGRVITSLGEKAVHIPYRESKLTRLLRDSLGGQTKTTVIATISPSAVHSDETLNTLEYAMRAKSITNKPQVNAQVTLTSLTKDYLEEINRLKKSIYDMQAKKGFRVPEECLSYWETTLASKREEQFNILVQIEDLEKEYKSLDVNITTEKDTLAQERKQLEEIKINQKDMKAELESERKNCELQEGMLSVIGPLRDNLHDSLHKELEQKYALETEVKKMEGKAKASMQEVRSLQKQIGDLKDHRARSIELFHKNMDDLSGKVSCSHDQVKLLSEECKNYVAMLKTGFDSASYICENDFPNLLKSFNELSEVNSAFQENMKSILQELKSAKLKSMDDFQVSHAVALESSILSPVKKALENCETSLHSISTALKNWQSDTASKANLRQTLLKQHLEECTSTLESTSESINVLICQLKQNLDEYKNIVSECASSEAVNQKLWNDHFFTLEKDLTALDAFCADYHKSVDDNTSQAHSLLKNYTTIGKDITSKLVKYCDTSIESMAVVQEELAANNFESDTVDKMKDSMDASSATYKDLEAEVVKCSSTALSLEKYTIDSEDIIFKQLQPKVTACIKGSTEHLLNFGENFKLALAENKCKVDTCISIDNMPVEKLNETTKCLTDVLESGISDFLQFLDNEYSSSTSEEPPKGCDELRRNDSSSSNVTISCDEETLFSQTAYENVEENTNETECPLCLPKTDDKTLKADDVFESYICAKNPLSTSYPLESGQSNYSPHQGSSQDLHSKATGIASVRKHLKFSDLDSRSNQRLDSTSEDD